MEDSTVLRILKHLELIEKEEKAGLEFCWPSRNGCSSDKIEFTFAVTSDKIIRAIIKCGSGLSWQNQDALFLKTIITFLNENKDAVLAMWTNTLKGELQGQVDSTRSRLITELARIENFYSQLNRS